jgi:hypothetical protein
VTLAGRPLHESGIRLSAAVAWKRPVLVNLPACHAIWTCSGSLEMGLYFLGPGKHVMQFTSAEVIQPVNRASPPLAASTPSTARSSPTAPALCSQGLHDSMNACTPAHDPDLAVTGDELSCPLHLPTSMLLLLSISLVFFDV